MISATRTFDRAMVRDFIEAHGLDPIPNEPEPDSLGWQGLTLTVERYSWGRACFAEWRARDVALTWVEYGERPELPEWAERIRVLLDRPECLGHHEADHVCDGGRNPQTGEREPACRWKAVCLYVQAMAGRPAGVPKVLEQFDQNDQLWERAAVPFEAPKMKAPTKKDLKRLAKTKEERAAARREASAENLARGKALIDRIVGGLMDRGGWTLNPNRWRAINGEYVLVEHPRAERSALYVLFRRRPRSWTGELGHHDHGTEQAICRFIPQSSAPLVTVQIRTLALDLVRDLCRSYRVAMVKGVIELTPYVTVNAVDDDGVQNVIDALYQIISGNLLQSWGVGAVDPGHPKPRTIGRFRRAKTPGD